jgi:hypothetical protein
MNSCVHPATSSFRRLPYYLVAIHELGDEVDHIGVEAQQSQGRSNSFSTPTLRVRRYFYRNSSIAQRYTSLHFYATS